MRRALTLIELVVAAAALAVLLAVALVALRGARDAAARASDLDRIRASLVDFSAWGNDHAGDLPNAGLPDDPRADWFYNGARPETAASMYPGQAVVWPRVMERWRGACLGHWHAAEGPEMSGSGHSADEYPRVEWCKMATRFEYSLTLMTRPELWQNGPSLRYAQALPFFVVVRAAQVAHPAAKGMLLFRPERLPRAARGAFWLVGFADSSASERDPHSAKTPAKSPFSAEGALGTPVLATSNGYLGVDF